MLLGGIAFFQIGLAQFINIRIANSVELIDELAIICGVGKVALRAGLLHGIGNKACHFAMLDGHGPSNILQRP